MLHNFYVNLNKVSAREVQILFQHFWNSYDFWGSSHWLNTRKLDKVKLIAVAGNTKLKIRKSSILVISLDPITKYMNLSKSLHKHARHANKILEQHFWNLDDFWSTNHGIN